MNFPPSVSLFRTFSWFVLLYFVLVHSLLLWGGGGSRRCPAPPGNSGPSVLQRLKDEIAEVANEIETLGSTEER